MIPGNMTHSNLIAEGTYLQRCVAAWRHYLQGLAYRHKISEFFLYVLFLSGLFLWDVVDVSWPVFRWSLFSHSIIGLLFPVTVGLFWYTHRKLWVKSRKPVLKITGRVIEWSLSLCALSGFFLFIVGANGSSTGDVVSYIHLVSGLFLTPIIFYHALKWSVLKFWTL